MAVSARLSELVRDATIGLSDFDVEELTGLTHITWQRLKRGWIPSDGKLIQFARGIDMEVDPFLQAAHEVRPPAKAEELLAAVLKETPLSQSARFKLMTLFRELMEEAHAESRAA